MMTFFDCNQSLFRVCLQSKLNCEVLHDDLAFEVRWAVAGESVVIQLVSKLGMCLGINYAFNPLGTGF